MKGSTVENIQRMKHDLLANPRFFGLEATDIPAIEALIK